jgi:hypothetical protein
LFDLADSELTPNDDFDNTWLPHFLSMALSSLSIGEAERAFEKIAIINFNYDRVLEHYLYSALQIKYGLDREVSARVISGLQTIRPYGRVGALNWEIAPSGSKDEHVMPFGANPELDHELIFSLSKNILTDAEQRVSGEVRNKITRALDEARVVVFLGFGFHSQNMQLFQVPRAVEWRRAFATAFHMDPANHPIMRAAISRAVGCAEPDSRVIVRDARAHNMLVTMRPAIMAATAM